ncbi:BTAD domain-containing putative transcriptional regulator [Micromonospora sp. NPDC049836]|uniref:BTAD domain-containing putative transcriptional regulator n=1 Tax=Micromonospora sp. NPDC049836 TaxID=3364274 RepID=UPI0037918592
MSGDQIRPGWRSTPARNGRKDEHRTPRAPDARLPGDAELGGALRRLADAGDRTAAHLCLVAQPMLFGPVARRTPLGDTWRDALRRHLAGAPDEAAARLADVPISGIAADAVQVHCFAAAYHLAAGEPERAGYAAEEAARAAAGCRLPAAAQAVARLGVLLAAAGGDEAPTRGGPDLAAGLPRADLGLFRLMLHLEVAHQALRTGDAGPALRHAEAAIRLAEATGGSGHEPYALSLAAAAKCQLGRLEDALADGAAGQRLRELAGVSTEEAFGLAVLGMVHRRRREPRQARQALEQALAALDSGARRPALRVWVLTELARVRAADDLRAARDLAEGAVTLAGDAERSSALLARGWVALLAGDTGRAHHDAADARTGATLDRRRATLVQALQLTVLASADPRAATGLLDDAATLCQELGDRAEEAAVRLIAARLRGRRARRGAEGAEQQLRRCGVRLDPGVADGLTAITLRVPAVAVHTLGDFRVFRSGTVVPYREWQSKKARDLLKILVAHRGRAVPRSRLMELLWPDETPSRTANRLSVLLSTLRRVLGTGQGGGRGPVLADRSSVAIDLNVVDVDVEAFLIAAEEAQAAQRAGHADAPRLLARADELYGGDFLADDPYDDWAQPLREEAQAAHTSVLRALAQHAGDTDQKLVYLMRLVHRDPYDEDAHLELVQVLRGAGRHGEAERRYRAYADRMRELGITPAGRSAPDEPLAATPPALTGTAPPAADRPTAADARRVPRPRPAWSTEVGPGQAPPLSYRPEHPRPALSHRG